MRKFSLPYGKSKLDIQIKSDLDIDTILPIEVKPLKNPALTVRRALENPLSKHTLQEYRNSSTIGIAINDKTRPVPTPNPLPLLLSFLEELGFHSDSITLFIGSGTHKPMTPDEYKKILPIEIINKYAIVPHDCDNSEMVDLGKTTFNTPVKINHAFYSCDLKLTVGNIEPHHFMGFSGGVKTAAIGLAGRETITANHAMLIHEEARSGTYDTNPLRQDIEEIGRKINIQFCLGTIMNEEKAILNLFFGHPETVMLQALPQIQKLFGVDIPSPYDLVIASPGGYPKDINLYQAQKGLTHAARITRDGGLVILLAACPEGSGSQSYEDYISNSESNAAIIKEFHAGYFKIGHHKAFQIARDLERINILLVTDMKPNNLKKWQFSLLQPEHLNQSIDEFTRLLPEDGRIAIMPAATRTMTELKNDAK